MFNQIHVESGDIKSHHVKLQASITDTILQEFSDLKSDEERFAFVYSLPVTHEMEVKTLDTQKSEETAKKLKDEGNKAFQSGDFKTALALYSKSVLKTEWSKGSTRELAVVIANRSAALYHLEQHQAALQDIDIVLSLDYPAELRYKVLERKARCLLATKQLKDALAVFRLTLSALDSAKLPLQRRQKMQTDVQIMLAMLGKHKVLTNAQLIPNEQAPPPLVGGRHCQLDAGSSALRVEQSEQMGRYVTAAKDVQTGDTLVVEPAHCAVLLAEHRITHCFHCFRRLVAPLPCPRCANVAFCSPVCRNTAMSSHHTVECPVLCTLWASGVSVTCLMALRILSQRGLQHFLELRPALHQNPLDGQAYRGSDYLTVYSLVRHEQQRTALDFLHRADVAVFLFRCLFAAGFFSEKDTCNGDGLSSDQLFIGGLLLHHLQLLQFNAHEVSELRADGTGSVFLGGGLYPTLALFNHSCDPSVARYFLGTTTVVRAIRPVAHGQMIAENYGPIFTQTPRAERQSTLRSHYWFDCTCRPCVENWPLLQDMNASLLRFRCEQPSCGQVVLVPADTAEFMVRCTSCQEYTNILKGLKVLQDTDAIFRTATKHLESGKDQQALDKFLEILALLDSTLVPPFRDYHLCQQGVRRCLLSLGNKAAH